MKSVLERILTIIVIAGMSLALSGCATVKSSSLSHNKGTITAPKGGAGVVYFLPMRRLKLKGEIKLPSDKAVEMASAAYVDAKTASEEAAKAWVAAQKKFDEAEAKLKDAQAPANSLPVIAEEIEKLRKAVDTEKGKRNAAKRTAERLANRLESQHQALLAIATDGKARPTLDLSVELLPVEPDPDAIFFARPWHSWVRDDELNITVNERGLLSSSEITADDRLDDIAVELAKTVGALALGPGVTDPSLAIVDYQGGTEDLKDGGDRTTPDFCTSLKPGKFEFILDPVEWLIISHKKPNDFSSLGVTDPEIDDAITGEVQLYRRMLDCFDQRLQIDRLGRECAASTFGGNSDRYRDDKSSPEGIGYENSRPYRSIDEKTDFNGYAYRPRLPYRVSIQKRIRHPNQGDRDPGSKGIGPDPCKDLSEEDCEKQKAAIAENLKRLVGAPPREPTEQTEGGAQGSDQKAGGATEEGQDKTGQTAVPKIVVTDDDNLTPDDQWITTQTSIILLTNEAPTAYIPIRSAAFVETKNTVKFTNGTISSWDTTRPSEVLEAVRLPLEIAGAVIQGITEFVQLKIDIDNQEQEAIKSQLSILQTEIQTEQLLLCISTARSEDTDPLKCFENIDLSSAGSKD